MFESSVNIEKMLRGKIYLFFDLVAVKLISLFLGYILSSLFHQDEHYKNRVEKNFLRYVHRLWMNTHGLSCIKESLTIDAAMARVTYITNIHRILFVKIIVFIFACYSDSFLIYKLYRIIYRC